MPIPSRILRAWRDDEFGPLPLSSREMDRNDRILKESRSLLYKGGRQELTMAGLAEALRMSRNTIKMAFCDLDNIMFEVIRKHLGDIAEAFARVPLEGPGRQGALIDAYLNLSRMGMGGPSKAHYLLVNERQKLPPDLAEQIENIRLSIGTTLAGPYAEGALNLLDTPYLSNTRLKATLATLTEPEESLPEIAPAPEPEATETPTAEPNPKPTPKPALGCSFLTNGPSYPGQITDYKPPPHATEIAEYLHSMSIPDG